MAKFIFGAGKEFGKLWYTNPNVQSIIADFIRATFPQSAYQFHLVQQNDTAGNQQEFRCSHNT